jgi:transposase
VSCYERATTGSGCRPLTAAGITNHVFDPASITVEQRARRTKTDRIDGEKLLGTLMAYCRGEPRVVRIVRVPSAEQEDAARLPRGGAANRGAGRPYQDVQDQGVAAPARHAGGQSAPARLAELAGGTAGLAGPGVTPRLLAEIEREHGL